MRAALFIEVKACVNADPSAVARVFSDAIDQLWPLRPSTMSAEGVPAEDVPATSAAPAESGVTPELEA